MSDAPSISPVAPPLPLRVTLRLLETTDLHASALAYDYFQDRPAAGQGLAALVPLIARARAEQPLSVLLDNGDLIQGSVFGDVALPGFAADPAALPPEQPEPMHPMHALMAPLGYAAGTLGNHDFNFGLDVTRRLIATSPYPYVNANVRLTGPQGTDEPLCPRWQILAVALPDGQTLHLGLTGVVPPQIMQWDGQQLRGRVEVQEMAQAVREVVPELRAAGADVVVVLAHTGLSAAGAGAGAARALSENALTELARIPGIDALLAGHAHRYLPGPDYADLAGVDPVAGTVHGVPAVMPGSMGAALGVLDLYLEQRGGHWQVIGHRAEVRRPAADPVAQPDLPPVVHAVHAAALDYLRQPLADLAAPLDSYWASVRDNAGVRLINEVQMAEVTRHLAGGEYAHLPVLSAAAAFKVGGRSGPGFYTDIPSGPMTVRHVTDLYLYSNVLQAVWLTGAEVHEWLERAAGQFLTLRPGVADQPLLDPAFPTFDHDVLAGLTYDIDLSQPPRYDPHGTLLRPDVRRVLHVTHLGKPLDPQARFVVATNHYRAAGGYIPALGPERLILDTGREIRDVLIAAIRAAGGVVPQERQDWRLRFPASASALFPTGPAVRRVPSGATLTGHDAQGFAVFRLSDPFRPAE